MTSQNDGREMPFMNWSSGKLTGENVRESVRTLRQMDGLYQNRTAWEEMDLDTIVYRVQWYAPVPEGTEGGLFWGTTMIEPGRVGEEFFMTYGHRHVKQNRAEYYSCIQGTGVLIMMDASGRTWIEGMTPGSVHYIRGDATHRVANTGQSLLKFLACWPSDAGHDYDVIRGRGFGARLVARNGAPVLVPTE
jgi:glucose-6-phosphate isomerase, archaeal